MNPAVAGLSAGTVLSLLGLWVVWPAVGRGPMSLLTRASIVFLGKLVAVVGLVLAVHAGNPAGTAAFAVGLAASVVVLLIAQAGLLAWRLKVLDGRGAADPGREQPERKG